MKGKNGFTLIEMLLVLAIVGILAGVLLVGIGYQRKRARSISVLKSMSSVLPYTTDCYMRGLSLDETNFGKGSVCSASPIEWPDISKDNCIYDDVVASDYKWRAKCDGPIYISCFGKDEARCCLSDDNYVCQ